MNRSKTHHYVPQSLLKNFSIDEKEKQVFAFDKTNDSIRPHSIKNAGSEKYFYSIRINEKEFNFENLFQDADNTLPTIITKIIANQSLSVLTKDEQDFLFKLTALQIVRTRASLNILKKIHNTLLDITNRISKEWDIPKENFEPQIEHYDEELYKTTFLDLEELINNFASILRNKITYLCYTSDDDPYWCSDNPVVQNNHLNFGDIGLSNLGTDIHFPISKNFLIVFSCRSHLYQGELKSQLLQHANDTVNKSIESINFKTKKNSEAENVLYYNSLQVRDSSRFVYSQVDNFNMAKNFLTDFPEYRNLNSDEVFSFERKEGEKEYPSFPRGKYLICNGKKAHHQIEIQEYDLDELIFEASSDSNFSSITKEEVISEMKLIEDGIIILLYREMIAIVIDEQKRLFKVKFINPEMAKFLKEINK